jgi:hypothetical protein
MILNERRRPGLPAELVGRVFAIWLAVVLLQTAAVLIAGRLLLIEPLSAIATMPNVVSVLTLGCAMLLIGRIAYRIFDAEIAGLACLAAAVAVPLMVAVRPGAFDFHGLQVVCALFALNGLMAREARYGGWAIGAALGSALALSLDGTLVALGFVAVVACKWLRNRAERWWLVHTLVALSVTAAGIVAARWAIGQLPICGALGVAHLLAFTWATGIIAVVALSEPHPRGFTVAGMVAAAGGAMALLALAAPGCTVGSALGLAAASPLWRGGAIFTLQAMGLPLLGFIAALRLIEPARDWLRQWWRDYAVLMLLAAIVTAFDARVAAMACALAAVPIGWQLREWSRAARNSHRAGGRALALTGVALALAPAMPISLLVLAAPSYAADLALG